MKTSFYLDDIKEHLRRFAPPSHVINWRDRWCASLGALCGLITASWSSYLIFGNAGIPLLIAPMGASAVLIFTLPTSPLAQPWSVIIGNVISAVIGVSCAQFFPAQAVAAAIAVALAILAMFVLRSLHPPGGAIALLAVMGGPSIERLAWHYVLAPVALQSASLVLCALFYHKLQGGSYPQSSAPQTNLHKTGDQAISTRLGVSDEDLDAVLMRQGKIIDISRADLRKLIMQVEIQAHQRHHARIQCSDIMSHHLITVQFETPLEECWQLLRTHKIGNLPVINDSGVIIGILSLIDFLKQADLDVYHNFDLRLRKMLEQARTLSGSELRVAGHIMSVNPVTAQLDSNVLELVPLFSDRGLHSIPIVDDVGKLCGMVTQSDLIAALYQMQSRVAIVSVTEPQA